MWEGNQSFLVVNIYFNKLYSKQKKYKDSKDRFKYKEKYKICFFEYLLKINRKPYEYYVFFKTRAIPISHLNARCII